MSFNPGSQTLAGSSDVNLSNPASNEVLRYSGATQKWSNASLGSSAQANIGSGAGEVMAGDDSRVTNRSNLYTIHGTGARVHPTTGLALPLPPVAYVRWISTDYPASAVQGDEWDIIGAPAMPQLSVVGSVINAATGAATTRTIVLPSGIQDGDTVLIIGVHTGSTSYSTITGISGIAALLPDKVQTGHHQYVWVKENALATDSSQTLTMSSFDSNNAPLALWNTIGAVVLRGTPTTNVIDPQNDALGDLNDTIITSPVITSSILACEFAVASAVGTTSSPANVFATPSGFTQIIAGTSTWTGGGGQTSLWIGYKSLTAELSGASMGGDDFVFPVTTGKWARTVPIGAAWV